MARTTEKAAYWAEIIRRYRQSGLTQARLCGENDVSAMPRRGHRPES